MFNTEELRRYHRQIIMPEIDMQGQLAIKGSKVLVVGSGGLGSPILLYLAAAGIGVIGIIDPDRVDITNLHRQVLYATNEVGSLKVQCAKKKILDLNPEIDVLTYPYSLTSDNAMNIINDFDIIVDGTDNFPTRYLINDACVFLDKTHIYGSIFRFEGQVSVFNHPGSNGDRGPNYRDIFPTPPPPDSVPDCATAGVMGVLPGIIGSLQANECIKAITGAGELLSGKLFIIDTLDYSIQLLKFTKQSDNPVNGSNPTIKELIDYEAFCGVSTQNNQRDMKTISVQELKSIFDSNEEHQLIDVRQAHERMVASIGGDFIPLAELFDQIDKIAQDMKVIFYCRSGIRSATAIRLIQSALPLNNLYNLKGGINAWATEIDPSIPTY